VKYTIQKSEITKVEETRYDLEERLLEFSVRIIRLSESRPATRAGNHVAGQLLRSGTAPLPMHGEAQAAESARDFQHKLRVALKELRETLFSVLQATRMKTPTFARSARCAFQ